MIEDGNATRESALKIDLCVPVRAETAVAIMQRLAAQVSALHAEGHVHRAISLAAIEQDPDGNFQLSPVSNARCLGHASISDGRMPPELQCCVPIDLPANLKEATAKLKRSGVMLDPRQIDIYQLGALLCHLVTGKSAESYLRSLRTKMLVPQPFRPIIERSLGCDGQHRFGTVEAFSDMLKSASTKVNEASASDDCANLVSSPLKPDTTPSMMKSGHPDHDTASGVATPAEHRDTSGVFPYEKLGHYEIVSKIGQGGMGDVFLGYERTLDRKVAIKVLPAEFARHSDFVQQFRDEATAAAKVVHPNVIQIYFIGESEGFHFFAMQFVDGETLADLLKRRGRLNVDEALDIFEHVLSGLAAAHNLGLVHRDIKPSNILLDRQQNRALLADFGLVKSLQDAAAKKTVTGMIKGTADYISPEQARGKQIDHRADLYSMGVLMYETLSGKLPFEADSATGLIFQHVYEQPPPLADVAPQVPRWLLDIIDKLLRKSPDERYQTAGEVLDDLRIADVSRPEPKVLENDDEPAAIEQPSRSANVDDFPLRSTFESDFKSSSWLGRARGWASNLLRRNSPEILRQWRNTQQQADDAIANYERRRARFRQLADEARSVLSDLREQAAAERVAAQTDPKATPAAVELERQVDEHEEQLASIVTNLAKVNATLQQLKTQRDLLNARLMTANRGAKLSGGGGRQSIRRTIAFAAAGLAVVFCAIFLLIPALRTETNSRKTDPGESRIGKPEPGRSDVPQKIEPTTAKSEAVQAIVPREEMLPLVRFYNHTANEHCYSVAANELGAWRVARNFSEQLVLGLVSTKELPGTTRLWRGVRLRGRRHVYYTQMANGAPPVTVQHLEFPVYVWTQPGDGRIPVFGSTWVDGADVYFDTKISEVNTFAENTKKALNVERRSLGAAPVFYVYPFQSPAKVDGPMTSAAQSPAVLDRPKVIPLPAPIDEVGVGAGGRLVFLHLKKLQQLAVFDVNNAKVTRYLPLASNDITYAAGATKLFIGFRDLQQIQRFDLGTLEREMTVPGPEGGIGMLAMGAEATSPLILLASKYAKRSYLVDTVTMESVPFAWSGWDGGAWGPVNVHVSFDGTTAVGCGGGWAGIEVVSFAAGKVQSRKSGSRVHGDTFIAGNGTLVYPNERGIIRQDLVNEVKGIDGIPFPAVDPDYSLAFVKAGRNPTLSIFPNNDPKRIYSVRDLPELALNSRLPLPQRILLIPGAKVLITVGEGGDRLVLRRFDLLRSMENDGLDFLFVVSTPVRSATRGSEYNYAIRAKSKNGYLTFALSAAPEGMTITDNELQWHVPTDYSGNEATVVVKISDVTGQEIVHFFKIAITK